MDQTDMGNVTPPAAARIYTLSDPRTLEVRYVGMTTKSLDVRLGGHLRTAHLEKNHRARWIRSLKNAGLVPVITEIEVVPVEQHAEAERRWIAAYRAQGARLVNATDGGDGTFGHKMSPEARKRISDSKKGKFPPQFLKHLGQKASPGTRERLRQAALRQYQDPAQRAMVSRVHRGKIISDAHRRIVGMASTKRWEAWRASGATVSDESRARMSAAQRERARKYGPQRPSPEGIARIAEAKRQFWAELRETGDIAVVRARMREGIARSGRVLTGLGTIQVDPDGTVHGSTGYHYGCRCDICRTASTIARRLSTAKAREAQSSAPKPPRLCQDCSADISHRYPNCKYCETCAAHRAEEANDRRNAKRRVK